MRHYQLKSKKTGKESIYTESEYIEMVEKGALDMKKFIVTELLGKPIIPFIKEVPKEIKTIKSKKA